MIEGQPNFIMINIVINPRISPAQIDLVKGAIWAGFTPNFGKLTINELLNFGDN